MDWNGGYPDEFWVKVKAYDIDYCVEEEDVCEDVINDPSIEEDSEEYYNAINKRIQEVKDSLPKELEFTLNYNHTIFDLEEDIVNAISNETGWLVNDYAWTFLGKVDRPED